MYYLLHGPDTFSSAEEIAALKRQVGAPDVVDLNTNMLDGRTLTLAELSHACDALPFLSDRRLVIVEGLVARLSPGEKGRAVSASDKELLNQLVAYIPKLPATTDLVLVESDLVASKHPLYELAAQKGAGRVKAFPVLKDAALEQWIAERARAKGVKIDAQAVHELALYTGNDLRLLDNELSKLATYAGAEQRVRVEDVHRLVSYVREESIFEMVDALGQRNGRVAMRLFHGLLGEGKEPLYVFSMIARQFRQLLQAKSLAEQQAELPQIMKELSLRHEFIATKLLAQARNFALGRLQGIYRELQRIDVAIKTGRVEPELALDVFITEICSDERARPSVSRRGAGAP